MITFDGQQPMKINIPPEVQLDRPTLASVAPQIQQWLFQPAAYSEFPIIAYQHSGTSVYQAIYTPP